MAWTTPRTWVAGEVITASLLNTHLRDNLSAIGNPEGWTSYSPQLTAVTSNPTYGTTSQVNVGWHKQLGKVVHFYAAFRFGSGMTAGSGAYRLSLPVTASSNYSFSGGSHVIGNGLLTDDSAGLPYLVAITPVSTSTVAMFAHGAGAVAPTVPFTFAASDYLQITGCYEAA